MSAKKSPIWLLLIVMAAALFSSPLCARALFDNPSGNGPRPLPKAAYEPPNTQWEVHNIGKIAMSITNYGTIGTGYISSPIMDGEEAPSLKDTSLKEPIGALLRFP